MQMAEFQENSVLVAKFVELLKEMEKLELNIKKT
jgi:hypothetical protein